jgi:hypothetical protein
MNAIPSDKTIKHRIFCNSNDFMVKIDIFETMGGDNLQDNLEASDEKSHF